MYISICIHVNFTYFFVVRTYNDTKNTKMSDNGDTCYRVPDLHISARQLTNCLSLNTSGNDPYICVGKLTIIVSDNGLSPGHAIIWTTAGILLIRPLGTNFNEILIEIHTFSFKKMHLKMSFAKSRPFCLGLNVLTSPRQSTFHVSQSGMGLNCSPIRAIAMSTISNEGNLV